MATFTGSIDEVLAALGGRSERLPGAGTPPEPGTFRAVVAVFLSRSGDARAVSAALDALEESGRLSPLSLAEADPGEVEDAFRSAGSRTLAKAVRPLQRLARWAAGSLEFGPDNRLDDDATGSTEALRDGLRGLNGVGPATADAILLHGLGRPAYPVDRATYRILARHGWLDPTADYDEARSLVEGALPDDPTALTALSLGFERLGREACRAGVPRCDRCPLRPLLPDGGPIEGG